MRETVAARALHKSGMRGAYIAFGVLAAVCWLAFAHPDIHETARHAWILIRSTLDGDFFQFFENTLSRSYGYPYANAAHYNILLYVLYAVWELPLYVLQCLGVPELSDTVLALWCKAIGAAAAVGCALQLQQLAKALDCQGAQKAPLAFLAHPITLFTVFCMGQYDSICLFFMLWALRCYFAGRLGRFSLLMGAALVCKMYALFLLVPLLLLACKRPLRLAGYAAASLWLYLPSTLLFFGRTGDAGVFNGLMADRVFATQLPGGISSWSAFGGLMALGCVAAWLYRPADAAALRRLVPYVGLAVYGALFGLVYWHPQWLLLLVPFWLLTDWQQRDRQVFFVLSAALCIGFFLLTATVFPAAMESNMLDFGAFAAIGPARLAVSSTRTNVFYFSLLPYLDRLAPVLFHGALAAALVYKLPQRTGTLADRLGRSAPAAMCAPQTGSIWWLLVLTMGAFWLTPSAYGYLNMIGIL